MAMLEEDEEKAGRFRDYMAKKKGAHIPPICDLISMTI
jgi:hypothetical protein